MDSTTACDLETMTTRELAAELARRKLLTIGMTFGATALLGKILAACRDDTCSPISPRHRASSPKAESGGSGMPPGG